jgi:hypothetical protein
LLICKKRQNEKEVVPMFILAQGSHFENSQNKVYRVQSAALEKQYMNAGYQKSERSYKIEYQHKEYTIICLVFRNYGQDSKPIVIIPEFLIPRRPYPVYVYLYAIYLYSMSPEKGQRWAAGETRKYFGLNTFSHTTLGRALKRFVCKLEEAAKASNSSQNEMSCNYKEKNEIQNANVGQVYIKKKSGFPTIHTTEALRKQAAQFLCGMVAQAVKQHVIEICCNFVRNWFEEYHQLLL